MQPVYGVASMKVWNASWKASEQRPTLRITVLIARVLRFSVYIRGTRRCSTLHPCYPISRLRSFRTMRGPRRYIYGSAADTENSNATPCAKSAKIIVGISTSVLDEAGWQIIEHLRRHRLTWMLSLLLYRVQHLSGQSL